LWIGEPVSGYSLLNATGHEPLEQENFL